MRRRNPKQLGDLTWMVAVATLSWPGPLLAQSNQFGKQDRADAAARMIVLGVQQAISSLPPTAGQSRTYEFDPAADTYVIGKQLGPTVLRSPQTIGARKFSIRLATSYLELSDTFAPIDYQVSGPVAPGDGLITRFGLEASSKVGIINLSGNYGFTNWFEVSLSLPLVVTDAKASQTFLEDPFGTPGDAVGVPFNVPEQVLTEPCEPGRPTGSCFIDELLALPESDPASLRLAETDLGDSGTGFQDGTNFGVGRIAVGTKLRAYSRGPFTLALAPEFFFPSPNEDELAGSDSASILPRAVAAVDLGKIARLYLDLGYDYDFDEEELRRFVWDVGISVPLSWASFDAGVGGSEYAKGIEWTPDHATFVDTMGRPGNTISALGDNTLGTTFIDFLGGLKFRLHDRVVLSGAVTVPMNDEGFRPDATGTVAIEAYL